MARPYGDCPNSAGEDGEDPRLGSDPEVVERTESRTGTAFRVLQRPSAAHVTIRPQALELKNGELGRWELEPGTFQLVVGIVVRGSASHCRDRDHPGKPRSGALDKVT
jgi:hypothetical protein